MVSGILENLALILIVLALVKMLIILINAKLWMSFVQKMYSNVLLLQLIFLILAAVVLYYLLAAGIGIVPIMAVSLFVSLLIGVGIAPYAKGMFKLLKLREIWSSQWFYVVLWLVLIVWALLEIA